MLSVGVEIVLTLVTLVSTPFLVRRLGPQSYGVLILVSILAGQLGILHLGLSPALTRRVAECRGSGDTIGVAGTWRAASLLGLGSGAVIGVTFNILGRLGWTGLFTASPELTQEAFDSMNAATVVVALGPLIGAMQGFLLGEERFGLASVLRLGHMLTRIGVAVGAVALGGRLQAILLLQSVVDIGVVLLSGLLAGRGKFVYVPPDASKRAARTLIVLGAPLAVVGALHSFLSDAEKLAIAVAASVGDLTYYSIPFGAASRIAVLTGGLWSLLTPRISRLATSTEGRLESALLSRQATRLAVVVMIPAAAILAAATPDLLALWLGQDFADRSTRVVRIVLLGVVTSGASMPASAVLFARSHPMKLVLLLAAEIPIHLGIVYIMVSTWGIEGAAIAWCLRVVLDGIAVRFLAKRELGTPVAAAGDIWGPMGVLTILSVFLDLATVPNFVSWPLALTVGVAATSWRLTREDRRVLRRVVWPRG